MLALLGFSSLFLLATPGRAQPGQSRLLIDDFHDQSSLAHWQFSNGAEFPGANGSLSLGQGHSGRGAKLNFRISCDDPLTCGHYVAAYHSVRSAAHFHALSMWVCLPLEIRLVIRVKDETGQTIQYTTDAPTLEQQDPNAWIPVVVALDQPPNCYWGGANTGRLTGAITEIGVLADSRNLEPSRGSLGFDDVTLLASAATAFNLGKRSRMRPLPASSASLAARLGVNVHSLNDEEGLDAARSARFTFVRSDLLWATVEKTGRYDFSNYDGLLSSLEMRDMGVLWILDYGHPEHGGSQPRTADDIAAYARYAQAATLHFKGHKVRYEIWNEPNLTSFLPDPGIFPALLRQATQAMRQVDKSVVISVGGVSGVDLSFLGNAPLAAAARETNAIGVHPYRFATPETLVPDFLRLRRFVDAKVLPGMPIWDTECGYSSAGLFPESVYGDGHTDAAAKRQAVLAARHMLTVWALGLPVAVWYDLRDDGSDSADVESNFGLLDQYGNDKPSMRAVRALTAAASQGNLIGLLMDVPAGLHVLALSGTRNFTFIVWCDQPGGVSQIRFTAGGLQAVSDMLGQEIHVSLSGNKSIATVTVAETDGPVYLRFRQSPAPHYQSLPGPRNSRFVGTFANSD